MLSTSTTHPCASKLTPHPPTTHHYFLLPIETDQETDQQQQHPCENSCTTHDTTYHVHFHTLAKETLYRNLMMIEKKKPNCPVRTEPSVLIHVDVKKKEIIRGLGVGLFPTRYFFLFLNVCAYNDERERSYPKIHATYFHHFFPLHISLYTANHTTLKTQEKAFYKRKP